MNSYVTVSLLDVIEGKGVEIAQSTTADYACPVNPDIEQFVNKRAVDFSLQGIAQTHLVYRLGNDASQFVGFFALANKVLSVHEGEVSKTLFKTLCRFGLYDGNARSVSVAMPLIAQLGKNFADGRDGLISGGTLLNMACDKVQEIQRDLGGKMTYLECENTPALVGFYERNGFRLVNPSAGAGELLQLIRRS